jgi:hypothetical protein
MGTQASSENGHGSEHQHFECAVCGTRRAAAAVEYDTLGYPVCPVCTYSQRP